MISSKHKGYIILMKVEDAKNLLKITITLGLELKTPEGEYLPFVGEIQLRFGYPERNERIDKFL